MFFLHNDLIRVVLSFEHDITPLELERDLQFYMMWQKTVPSIFLQASCMDERYFSGVSNPMIRFNPYYPRKYLRLEPVDIWAHTLPAFINMLCKEMVRDTKTYKGCIARWTYDCVCNRQLYYWNKLMRKGLSKLKKLHFRSSAPPLFVEEALRQISVFSPALEV